MKRPGELTAPDCEREPEPDSEPLCESKPTPKTLAEPGNLEPAEPHLTLASRDAAPDAPDTDLARAARATARALIESSGSTDQDLARRMAAQVTESLWLPEGLSEEEQTSRIAAARAALREIAPRGALEGLLASQMVATHAAALECLRRAMIPDQPGPARDANLRHATKLMALFAQQLETLERHKGRSRHRVTVEHVKVERVHFERRDRAEHRRR